LFIPGRYVSVEGHGDDDDAVWIKLLTRTEDLSGNPTIREIWEGVGIMYEGVRILRINIRDTSTDF
jgi:hypothetical protein